MNCADIKELSPLWHSNELEDSRRVAFDRHVDGCAACGRELREQCVLDAQLRASVAEDAALRTERSRVIEARVRGQISSEQRKRWLFPTVAAAAAAIAAVVFLTVPKAAPPNPVLVADASRDHTIEVVQKSPRRWRTAAGDIAALEQSQGVSDADVKAIEATGYQLQRAKICHVAGLAWMHLVYAKDGKEFSVYLRVKRTQPVTEAAAASGPLQLATFSKGRVEAIVVTATTKSDCDKFTQDAADAL